MELAGKSVQRRMFNSLFLAVCLFVVTALTNGGIEWTLILVGVPLFFVLELFGDVLGGRIREWRAS